MPPTTAASASAAKKQRARERAGLCLPVNGITDVLRRNGRRRVRRATSVALVAGVEWYLKKLIKETAKRTKRADKAFVRLAPANIDRTVRDMSELRHLLRLPNVPRPIGGALAKKAAAPAK